MSSFSLDYDDERKAQVKEYGQLLKAYFDNDGKKRFQFQKAMGAGASGLAWLIKFNPAGGFPNEKKIILKTNIENALTEKDYVEGSSYKAKLDKGMEKEVNMLKKLRFARHIARILEIGDDPLQTPFPLRPHRNEISFYMECLPNGQLYDFLERVIDSDDISHLPNRVLWRMFLCLIRACIGMQWPPEDPGDGSAVKERVRASAHEAKITHGDMHNGNIMIDDFTLDEDEHDLFPALKLIDFGMATEDPSDLNVEDENVWDIGLIMMTAITLEHGWIHTYRFNPTVKTKLTPGGPEYDTVATGLLPDEDDITKADPVPWLDNDLRALVCACLAKSDHHRPKVVTLATAASKAVETYDAMHYMNQGSRDFMLEGDSAIKAIVREFLHAPPEY
ncbi:hypothetical protein PFICI_10228 [Pestalotiopsis fici W106-1]|uniref:Protein kinase domain-containing protein n=1 Tax=Pestalotiopsis fici (strain W106-1 / CGMCC3.15140) TaxID=1229662 RepID=W3WZ50_PESFW|nr:uncharacterized protein PFICI_10228 [Pestalotiopsis fici W106-1]ETS78166.1 hypothetical protein PFICI_10228 [Pestalotiopsis fici W106-1]